MTPQEQLIRALELLRGGYIEAAYEMIEAAIKQLENRNSNG